MNLAVGAAPVLDDADPRRWRALAVLGLVQFIIVIDSTIVNVALPSIAGELALGPDGLAWVINGYLLTAGGLLLLGGRIADLAGRTRMFMLGAVVFAAASLVCGLAPSGEVLIAGRFAQGAGEALASPAALSLIAVLFRRPDERAKALGIWGGLVGLGATCGVLLSGVLVELADWRWIFLINLPFAVAAVILLPRLVPPQRPARSGARIDLPGALLVTGGLIGIVYGVLGATRHDWSDPAVWGPMVAGALALVAFVLVEARSADPLVPLRFFAHRTRVTANVASVFMIGVLAAMFLLLTLYLQEVLGYSALQAGLAYLPFCLLFVAAAFGGMVLTERLGARRSLVLAFGAAAIGMALLTRIDVGSSYVADLLPATLILAVGFGIGFPGLQTAALHEVSDVDAGLGSGVQTSVQALANALGVAVFLTVAVRHSTAQGGGAAAVVDGYRLAFGVGTASLVLGAVLVALFVRTTSRTAEPAPAG